MVRTLLGCSVQRLKLQELLARVPELYFINPPQLIEPSRPDDTMNWDEQEQAALGFWTFLTTIVIVLNSNELVTVSTFELNVEGTVVPPMEAEVLPESTQVEGKVRLTVPLEVEVLNAMFQVQLETTLILQESLEMELIALLAWRVTMIMATKSTTFFESGLLISNEISYYTVDGQKNHSESLHKQSSSLKGERDATKLQPNQLLIKMVFFWECTFGKLALWYVSINSSLLTTPHASKSLCILFMQYQRRSNADSHSHQFVARQEPPVSEANSFQRFLHILNSQSTKKVQKAVENQQKGLNCLQQRQTCQNRHVQAGFRHSRSRDKRRRLPKTRKNLNKQKRGALVSTNSNIENLSKSPVFSSQQSFRQSNKKQSAANPRNSPILYSQSNKVVKSAATTQNTPMFQTSQLRAIFSKEQQKILQSTVQTQQQKIDQNGEQSILNRQNKKIPQVNKNQAQDVSKKVLNAHNQAESESINNQNKTSTHQENNEWFKSKLCYDFLYRRCKKMKNQCTYAHGFEDMRPENRLKHICRNYLKGICKKPQKQCKYYHQRDNKISSQNNNSFTEENQRKQPKFDQTKKAQKQEKRLEKREPKNLDRKSQKKSQKKEAKKDDKRLERKEQRGQSRIMEDRNPAHKKSKWFQQSQTDFSGKELSKVSEKRELNKRYAETCQKVNHQDINLAYMTSVPYQSFNNGYLRPNNYPQQYNYYNRPDQMLNSSYNNIQGYSPFSGPLYFPNTYSSPQQYTFHQSQAQFSNPHHFVQQHSSQNRSNVAKSLQPNAFPLPQAFTSQCLGPSNYFYPAYSPQNLDHEFTNKNTGKYEDQVPHIHNYDYSLNNASDQRKQNEKPGRELKTRSRKDRSFDRNDQKNGRKQVK